MPTVKQMIELSDTLTKTQTRIFEYMLNHPEAVCYDTLRNTAERIGVTEVSVLKVCRKLGCSGYAEMKEVFRHYVGERLKDSFDRSYTLGTVDDRSHSDRGALLRSMFGMPPIWVAIPMAFEMATYGAIAGLLYRKLPKTGWRIYASLISAMVAGRLVWGLVKFLLAGLQGTEFSLALFLSGAVTTAIPGIILQLILIPILVVVMERTNMALDV